MATAGEHRSGPEGVIKALPLFHGPVSGVTADIALEAAAAWCRRCGLYPVGMYVSPQPHASWRSVAASVLDWASVEFGADASWSLAVLDAEALKLSTSAKRDEVHGSWTFAPSSSLVAGMVPAFTVADSPLHASCSTSHAATLIGRAGSSDPLSVACDFEEAMATAVKAWPPAE